MRNTVGVVERARSVAEPSVTATSVNVPDDHAHVAWFVVVYGASAAIACAVLGLLASVLV
jgi:hypothetical protein